MNIIQSGRNTFSMSYLGKIIAKQRKELNLTQSEVAERLGVSHQAISSWENGMTSPDISKLPDLSELLGVSVDELLGNKHFAELVEKANNEEGMSVEEVIDIAPITKPETLSTFYETLDDSVKDMETVLALAPFVDEEKLMMWVGNLGNVTLKELSKIAPFLDESYLSEIVLKHMDDHNDINDATGLLPFLDEETISVIFARVLNDESMSLGFIAPFVEESVIDDLVVKAINEKSVNAERYYSLAPFMSSRTIEAIVTQLIREKRSDEISMFAPFL